MTQQGPNDQHHATHDPGRHTTNSSCHRSKKPKGSTSHYRTDYSCNHRTTKEGHGPQKIETQRLYDCTQHEYASWHICPGSSCAGWAAVVLKLLLGLPWGRESGLEAGPLERDWQYLLTGPTGRSGWRWARTAGIAWAGGVWYVSTTASREPLRKQRPFVAVPFPSGMRRVGRNRPVVSDVSQPTHGTHLVIVPARPQGPPILALGTSAPPSEGAPRAFCFAMSAMWDVS